MLPKVVGGPGFSRATAPSPLLALGPSPIELGFKAGADGRASQRHKVVVLARLA
jgi:hypothetical protein